MGRRRAREACSSCRILKRKCDEGSPCEQCKKRNLQCYKKYLSVPSTELLHTDRQTSANPASSYTYFFYRIRQGNSNLEGFGYVFGDGNLIVDHKVLPVLRKTMSMVTKDQRQRIWHKDLTVEILFSEKRQSAELMVLQDGQVCITAEFFGEASGQEVKVSLWDMANGTTKELGHATSIRSTQWYIVTNYEDLLGQAVIFTRRQGEEVVSLPVSPESHKVPVHESPGITSPSNSASLSATADSTVGSPPRTNALFYNYQTWRPSSRRWQGIIVKHGSVSYTYRINNVLRSTLLNLEAPQDKKTTRTKYSQLSTSPYEIQLCTESYDEKKNLHLQANFSKDISGRFVSIKTYASIHSQGSKIHVPQDKRACQCSIVINALDYPGDIIVFECDNEFIVSHPVK
ncbi:hypothetical protein FOCG_13857 [Fusarium oxysporum f. sp. radicis-lycopersici 26381]|nr:hypothetical protein FOCG_13857 [Fusarium oxysporum f. sp. radicis-lycopersici 26381]